jgi:hypothetical protein
LGLGARTADFATEENKFLFLWSSSIFTIFLIAPFLLVSLLKRRRMKKSELFTKTDSSLPIAEKADQDNNMRTWGLFH